MATTFTTAFPTSAKGELPQAIHNYTTTTGHVFKVALGNPAGTGGAGTYGAGTTNYSNLGTDEVANGNGYVTGGFAWTVGQNNTPVTSGTGAYWQWSLNPNWPAATFSTNGCVIYNSSAGNRAVYVGSFGGTQTVSGGTLTLIQPSNAPGQALLQLN